MCCQRLASGHSMAVTQRHSQQLVLVACTRPPQDRGGLTKSSMEEEGAADAPSLAEGLMVGMEGHFSLGLEMTIG